MESYDHEAVLIVWWVSKKTLTVFRSVGGMYRDSNKGMCTASHGR